MTHWAITLVGAALAGVPESTLADLAFERAEFALRYGWNREARDLVAPYLTGEAEEWRFHRLYLDSTVRDGLAVQARAAYEVLSVDDPSAALAWRWYEAEHEGRGLPDLAELKMPGAPIALASVALRREQYVMAASVARRVQSPEAAEVVIAAEMALGESEAAVLEAGRAMEQWPLYPQVLVGLWRQHLVPRSVSRARAEWLSRAADRAEVAGDAVLSYRVLRLAEDVGHHRISRRMRDHLSSLGERLPARDVVAARLERFDIAEREGRDALALNRYSSALDAAWRAARAAVQPVEGDLSRLDSRRMCSELAEAEATRGAAWVGQHERGKGTAALTIAALLDPETWEEARSRMRREPLPDLAAQRAVEAVVQRPSVVTISEAIEITVATADPRGVLARSRLGALLDARARLAVATGEVEDALIYATEAAWIDPSGPHHAYRAQLLEQLGAFDAAFVAWAVAQTYGADAASAALARLWQGPGAWEPVAVSVAESFIAGLPGGSVIPADQVRPRIGQPLPDFSLETPQGQVTLQHFRGRVVVVAFWASWCGPCITELPVLSQLSKRLAGEGLPVDVLAISVDERRLDYERVRRRPQLSDLIFSWNPELGSRFQVMGIPSAWVVDTTGSARFHHVGYAEGDAQTIESEIRALLDSDAQVR